jgi:hypothetical protein
VDERVFARWRLFVDDDASFAADEGARSAPTLEPSRSSALNGFAVDIRARRRLARDDRAVARDRRPRGIWWILGQTVRMT